MTQPTESLLVTRIRGLAQHELAHYVTAIALGFEGQEVTFKVHATELVHRGKSKADNVAKCDNLYELREFMHKRAIVLLAGVMGETVTRTAFQVDMKQAYQLLESGETGAGQDYSVAKELAQLLANSASETGDGTLPGRGAGSMRMFQELFTHAATMVAVNAKPICALADILAARVKPLKEEGFLGATVTLADIELTQAFQTIQRVGLSELAGHG